MKRNLDKLLKNKEDSIERIKGWLEAIKKGSNTCPFKNSMRDSCECYDLFPRSMEDSNCPCTVYSMRYVIKVAKEILKELEK